MSRHRWRFEAEVILRGNSASTARCVNDGLLEDLKTKIMDNKLLADFLSKCYSIESPNIDKILELEDLFEKVYHDNRIRIGFGEANIKAYLAVIEFLQSEKKEVVSDSNAESSDLHASYPCDVSDDDGTKLGESVTVPLPSTTQDESFDCICEVIKAGNNLTGYCEKHGQYWH